MKSKNQKIGCTVESCKHWNCDKNECLLTSIKVVSDGNNASCKEETICDSYDKKED